MARISNFWLVTLIPFYPNTPESGIMGMECLIFEKNST